MALLTLGTAATTTLSAIRWNHALSGVSPNASVSDLAALNALIKQQRSQGQLASTTIQAIPSVNQGVLYIPARGHLRLHEGDYIAVDPVTGEAFVINATSAAGASWVRSA